MGDILYFVLWTFVLALLTYSMAMNTTGNAPIKTKRIVLAMQIPAMIYVIWSILR